MKDLQKLIDKLIDNAVVGCDTYKHNSSTWLIFTNDKKWVIELTKEGTLWYNYYFFQKLFKVIALDVVENQHYITKWVEDNVINGVKEARALEEWVNSEKIVDKTIQNGVKSTRVTQTPIQYVEDAIENGVKETNKSLRIDGSCVIEDTIQNGVKDTFLVEGTRIRIVEETIQNGVKHTQGSIFDNPTTVKDTIQNGVKVTYSDKIPHEYDWSDQFTEEIDDIIKNGVKQCIPSHTPLYNPMDFSVEYRENHRLDDVASVLENGIKEVQPLPSQEGNMDWGNYYHRQEDRTKPHTQYVDDVITNGIKETKPMDEWVNTERIVDGVICGGSLIR